MHHVLLVDDKPSTPHSLRHDLEGSGYTVHEAGTDHAGVIPAPHPEVILLNLEAPVADAMRALNELRSRFNTPIIVLSSRQNEEEIVELLNAGADDYVTKPFGMSELVARINVALRWKRSERGPIVFSCGELRLDFEVRKAFIRGLEIRLTPSEYTILSVLARHRGQVVPYAQLLQRLWGSSERAKIGRLRIHMTILRSKIEQVPSRPRFLFTEIGVGYRLGCE